MSSEPLSASEVDPCPCCGSTAAAPFLGPRELPLSHWRRASPAFAQWLAVRGWPDAWRLDGYEADRWTPRRSPCSHEQSSRAAEYLAHLEAQLAESPDLTPASARHDLLRFLDTLLCMDRTRAARARLTAPMRALAVYELRSLASRLPRLDALGDIDLDILRASVVVLIESGQSWPLTRALVELLRAAPVPTLAPDLKYWGDRLVTDWPPLTGFSTQENSELAADADDEKAHQKRRFEAREYQYAPRGITESKPPAGWAQIPSELGYALHYVFADAEDSDPQLERLRNEFARHLLRRLKPGDNFDPSVEWRIGYIHAVVALRVNPDGRGHRVLHHVQSEDPSPQVKDAARTAYPKLRACPGLTGSPRRACLDAIWELFRAHMRALDAEVDEAGALRVKREMIRRTTRPKEE